MSAKFRSFESLLKPDPKFKDKMMGKFINCLMEGGKKSTAQKIFYTALEEVHKKIADKDLQAIFTQAIRSAICASGSFLSFGGICKSLSV